MSEGRRRELWDHTAHLMCVVANVFGGDNRRTFQPRDFHPFPAAGDNAAESQPLDERQNRANWKSLKTLYKSGAFARG